MDIQSKKNKIIERLRLLNDISLIEMIRNLLDYGLKNQEGRISIEQYNNEIDQAEAEVKKGRGINHESVKKQIKGW